MKSFENKEIIFSHVTFLSSSAASVIFNISSSHANTNLPTKLFHMINFLYLIILQFYMSYCIQNYMH